MSESSTKSGNGIEAKTFIDKVILFCLLNKLVVAMLVLFFVMWGIMVAPFDWNIGWLPRNPVAVDAIPDIGENQQIVFTERCRPQTVSPWTHASSMGYGRCLERVRNSRAGC